jgi:signal transduction histidine kinase/CheY-like chemotaxis protein
MGCEINGMSGDRLNNHTGSTIFSRGFLRSGILQILAWPLLCIILATWLWYWTLSKIDAETKACEKRVLAEATSLCKDYAQYLTQSIEQANQITLQVQYAWEQSGVNLNLRELSKGGLFRNPHINNVIVVNREGRPVTSTLGNLRNVSLADRDFFIYHKNDDSKALLVGKPLVSRTTGKAAIPFTRRLNTSLGVFDGVAVAGFAPHYLTSFYAGAFPGRTGVLMVAGLDGTLRSATIGGGTHDSTPAALRAVPLFNEPEGATYLSGEQWFGDNLSRYVAWKTLEGYPLVAMVGLSAEEYFAPYREVWGTDRTVAIAGSIILLLFALASAGMSRRLVRKKHQEEEVRKAYRIATEGGNEGFYMYEALYDKSGAVADFVLVDCNERGAEFYGIPQTQLLRTKLSGLYAGADFHDVMNIFRGAMASGFHEDEIQAEHESSLRIEWARRRLVRSGNGLAVTVQDIGERKRAEEDLKRMNERLVLATHAGRVGVWDWDIPKNELVWDDSMYSLYGIEKGSFGGAYDAWACTIHPQDKAHTEGAIQAALRGEQEYAPEFRIVRPDGTIRYLKADSRTFRGEDGKPLRMIGTNIDISELKRAEEALRTLNVELEERVLERTRELQQAKEAAEAANRAKSVFLANMSHELRTPLNAIIGFSDIMQRDPDIRGSWRETLGIIKKSGDHLLGLINDVLDIAKIESGRIELEHKPFDLGAMVLDVTDLFSVRAANKGLSLLLDQSSEFPRYIVGDETKIRQILINLISNAIKATDQGNVTVGLKVKHNHATHLLMEVADTGCGIAEEDRDKLFQPFVQVGPQGRQQGTGLGLAITRQFAELMGGSISVTSSVGRGSTFRVEVVVQPANPEDIPQAPVGQGDVTGLEPGQPPWRVLVVEDQQDNRILLMGLLERAGFQARLAVNGAEAVELFSSWQPHFIWMDQRMPVMDGVEATRRIRALPGGDAVKIAAVTASTYREEDAELAMAGFDAVVHKPYRPAEIYDGMERLLGVRFVRADAETSSTSHRDFSGAALDIALDLVPDPLLKDLDEALLLLDSERILMVIGEIGHADPDLAAALGERARNYDFTAIREALQGRRFP